MHPHLLDMNTSLANGYSTTLNLLGVWANLVLYYRGVYPDRCFKDRTVFNRLVKVAKEGPLDKYITEFLK